MIDNKITIKVIITIRMRKEKEKEQATLIKSGDPRLASGETNIQNT